MERKTKKEKKDGDTCRDCWTKRFRNDIYEQWVKEDTSNELPLPEFLNRELQARENEIKTMRELFSDLYDEIGAIEHLAGDLYMSRFDKEEKED